MTQKELAEMVHVTFRTIISLEKGKYNPSLMLAYRIAEVFDISLEELYCLEENKKLEDKKYEDKNKKTDDKNKKVKGALAKYKNTDLIEEERDVWELAIREKYDK